MIRISRETRVFVATQPADFRCGIDGLAAECRKLAQDPFSGAVFIFINRSKTMIRALVYERNGFWLCSKRLSQGKFNSWVQGNGLSEVQAADLMQFLMHQVWKKT